jgi:steroid delta-isomerase-like uncharacterized protein
MGIPHIPPGKAESLTSGQRAALASFYGALGIHDVDLLDGALAENWEDIPLAPGQEAGPEGVKPILRMLLSAFPDLTLEIIDVLAEPGRAAAKVSVAGTHQGDFFGVPATGKTVQFALHEFHEFESDRLRRTWHMEDLFGLFAQVGSWPSLAQEGT